MSTNIEKTDSEAIETMAAALVESEKKMEALKIDAALSSKKAVMAAREAAAAAAACATKSGLNTKPEVGSKALNAKTRFRRGIKAESVARIAKAKAEGKTASSKSEESKQEDVIVYKDEMEVMSALLQLAELKVDRKLINDCMSNLNLKEGDDFPCPDAVVRLLAATESHIELTPMLVGVMEFFEKAMD